MRKEPANSGYEHTHTLDQHIARARSTVPIMVLDVWLVRTYYVRIRRYYTETKTIYGIKRGRRKEGGACNAASSKSDVFEVQGLRSRAKGEGDSDKITWLYVPTTFKENENHVAYLQGHVLSTRRTYVVENIFKLIRVIGYNCVSVCVCERENIQRTSKQGAQVGTVINYGVGHTFFAKKFVPLPTVEEKKEDKA